MAEMMKGNIAIGEAAVRAGVRFYAGYPITPSTEIMEYLSWRLEEVGGAFVQADNEIAGASMVQGALASGVRALTASSGNGISLKQETLSILSDDELPGVIINLVRYGNGLATLLSAQTDYNRETRGGGHGDYRCIVLTPSSVQELVDMVGQAYDLAEKYKMVVVIMAEGALGQMMEPVVLPEFIEAKRADWGIDGKQIVQRPSPYDITVPDKIEIFRKKYAQVTEEVQMWESEGVEDADYVMVAFGLVGRSCIGAVKELREEGYKVGIIRPKAVWPFPAKAFESLSPNLKGLIAIEGNATGQMVEDVAIHSRKYVNNSVPIFSLPCNYGIPIIEKVKEDFNKILKNEIKERF